MALPDPFARKSPRAHQILAAAFAGIALLLGAAFGWRHAAVFLALAAGSAVHVAFAGTPPNPRGERVPGAILVRTSLRRGLYGVVAGVGVYIVETAVRALSRPDGAEPWVTWSVLAFVAAVPVFLVWGRLEVRLTSRGIERRSALGRVVKLSWPDVAEIRYEDAFVVHGRGVRILVPTWSDGLGDFAAEILANAPAAAIAASAEEMRERLADMASRLRTRSASLIRR